MDDVAIAGAGPAGALAALILARAGVRVRVFERARFPRPKLCGDSLNPGACAVLRRLGLADAIARGALPIDGMVVTGDADPTDRVYSLGGLAATTERRTAEIRDRLTVIEKKLGVS